MVDRDALLRKAVDKLCDSMASLKVEQSDAVVSLLDGHDVLAVLPTGFYGEFEGRTARCSGFLVRWTRRPRCVTNGIREEFDFPSLCTCGRSGTRAASNGVGALTPAEYHP